MVAPVFCSFLLRSTHRFQPLSPWAAYGIDRSLANHSHIRVDIRAPVEFRITGLKKEKLPAPEPVIFIQVSVSAWPLRRMKANLRLRPPFLKCAPYSIIHPRRVP